MSTRNERRQEKAKIKKRLANPLVRRILKSELDRGRKGTEVFRLEDDGTGNPLYFNISEMRPWAEANLEISALPVDFDRAKRMVESGAIDSEHLHNHTIQRDLEPIIVCRGLLKGDQIVDGAHRFVAFCMGAVMHQIDLPMPGYVLEPVQWRPFVIPISVARTCGFK